jgi:hypothetical protein
MGDQKREQEEKKRLSRCKGGNMGKQVVTRGEVGQEVEEAENVGGRQKDKK